MSAHLQKPWRKMSPAMAQLRTLQSHRIEVEREQIPIIFVPGIMGTRLRRSDGGKTAWDPDSWRFLWSLSGEDGAYRRELVIGDSGSPFNQSFLEPMDSKKDQTGEDDGTNSLYKGSYEKILQYLSNTTIWGPLNRAFEFPVYGFGFNWTDTCMNNGVLLSDRIDAIIGKQKQCDSVILVTHSMGGLVARSATKHRNHKNILGIVHGVIPAIGSPVAYWRMKAGMFASSVKEKVTARILGKTGPEVSAILGNAPGALELLPTKDYPPEWLEFRRGGDYNGTPAPYSNMPSHDGDPHQEIYQEEHQYWRLTDPLLLDPERTPAGGPPLDPDEPEADTAFVERPWNEYLRWLAKAKRFHDWIGAAKESYHPETYTLSGTGNKNTAEKVTLVENLQRHQSGFGDWRQYGDRTSYGTRAFYYERRDALGFFWARLEVPRGDGDGTVPSPSGQASEKFSRSKPAPIRVPKGDHEGIYKTDAAQSFVHAAIVDLCLRKKLEQFLAA